MTTLILAITIAMGVSFLCSIMEAAILSLNPGKLALLQQRNPRAGKICSEFKKNIEKPIAVILILNTAAHTFGASIAGAEFDEIFGSSYIWLFSLVFTILMVQYTEILPKTLGVRFNLQVMQLTSGFLKLAIKIMNPIIWLVHFVNRPFETRKGGDVQTASLDELDALATEARKERSITPLQERALHEIPDLQEDDLTQIMIPISRAICVDAGMGKDDVLATMKRYKHSRYPVRALGNPEEIIGVIEMRRMMFCEDENWQRYISVAPVIDASSKLLKIAENVQQYDSKILLVQGSDGKIDGILTTNNLFMHLFSKPDSIPTPQLQ